MNEPYIKPGARVLIERRSMTGRLVYSRYVGIVQRVTKTLIVTDIGRFNRESLIEVGSRDAVGCTVIAGPSWDGDTRA